MSTALPIRSGRPRASGPNDRIPSVMIYKPGREGLAFFRRLVAKGARGWRLEELCFSAEAIEFSLVREARRLRLEAVLPRSTGRRCLFSNPGLGVRLRNDREDMPPDDIRAAQGVFQALSGATFVGLFRRLMRDALYYADSRGTQPQSRLERYYRLADHSSDWWKFFYRKSSFLDQEVVLGTRGVKVNHGTWECRFNSADHDFSALRYFADEGNAGFGAGLAEVHTGLGEKEVMGGKTLEVLAAALRRAARENRPDCIHLNSTCMPELLGEDPRPLVAAVAKEFRLPVFWTSKTRDSGESLQEVLRQMLGRIRFSARRDPRAVILAGVASPEAQAEAGRLVGLLGLRTVGCLYPKLDLRSMPRVGTASALIWVNPVGWERLGDGRLSASGARRPGWNASAASWSCAGGRPRSSPSLRSPSCPPCAGISGAGRSPSSATGPTSRCCFRASAGWASLWGGCSARWA